MSKQRLPKEMGNRLIEALAPYDADAFEVGKVYSYRKVPFTSHDGCDEGDPLRFEGPGRNQPYQFTNLRTGETIYLLFTDCAVAAGD